MKKIIINLIVMGFIGTIGGLYYVWQEATNIPADYAEASTSNRDNNDSQSLPLQPTQIVERATVSKQKIDASIDRAKSGDKVVVKLTEWDINNLIVDRVAASQPHRKIPVGVNGIKTNFKDGKIYTGAIVNLDKLAQNIGTGNKATALNKLTDKLTFLKNRDVYIGVVGKPIVTGTQIKFDRDTQIKLGNMSWTIDRLAHSLGVAPDKIQKAIDFQIQQQNFQINRVALDRDSLEIEGKKGN